MAAPDILFSGGSSNRTKQVHAMVKAGTVRKVLQGVYTTDLLGRDEDIIRRNWPAIVAHKYQGAVLSHRSALEFQPSPHRVLYFTFGQDRVVRWPGVTLKFAKGPGAKATDRELFGGLPVSGEARAFLENLMPARTIEGERRTLERHVLEERLLRILDARGEEALNGLRDAARDQATALGMTEAFQKLDRLIGALLATKDISVLASPAGRARAAGEPYDTGRLVLFDKLLVALLQAVLTDRPERTTTVSSFRDLAFFESYFSNYIEGTEFEVDEAADIIYRGAVWPNRTEDSHDIRGTFELCADRAEMEHTPTSGADLIELLRARHAVIMGGRPDKAPGRFKERANRAGETTFVEPHLVIGTLKAGFDRMTGLSDPLARALYMMFLISETHPFNDGNGRIARVMMNAELVHAGRTKIIVPTVLREDYLLALRRLTRQHDPAPFIRMMDRAHAWSHWLLPDSYEALRLQMVRSNAFRGPDEASLHWPA